MKGQHRLLLLACILAGCSSSRGERLIGQWSIEFDRDSAPAPWWEFQWTADTLRLRPPVVAGTIQFDSTLPQCRDCVDGSFAADLSPLLHRAPPDSHARGRLANDSVIVVLGLTGDMGELNLAGFITDGAIVGRWNQIFGVYPYDGGVFRMSRRDR